MSIVATTGTWRFEIKDDPDDEGCFVHGFVDGMPRTWDVTEEVNDFMDEAMIRNDMLADFAFGVVEKKLGHLAGADYDSDEGFLMTWPTPEFEDNPELNLPSREEVLGLTEQREQS